MRMSTKNVKRVYAELKKQGYELLDPIEHIGKTGNVVGYVVKRKRYYAFIAGICTDLLLIDILKSHNFTQLTLKDIQL